MLEEEGVYLPQDMPLTKVGGMGVYPKHFIVINRVLLLSYSG